MSGPLDPPAESGRHIEGKGAVRELSLSAQANHIREGLFVVTFDFAGAAMTTASTPSVHAGRDFVPSGQVIDAVDGRVDPGDLLRVTNLEER